MVPMDSAFQPAVHIYCLEVVIILRGTSNIFLEDLSAAGKAQNSLYPLQYRYVPSSIANKDCRQS